MISHSLWTMPVFCFEGFWHQIQANLTVIFEFTSQRSMELWLDPNANFCYTKQRLLKTTRMATASYFAFQVILTDCIFYGISYYQVFVKTHDRLYESA